MDKKKVITIIIIFLLLFTYVLIVYVFKIPVEKEAIDEPEVEEFTKVGVLKFYFEDRYGCSVQSHLYYPSTYGANSPPVKRSGGYPAVVFGCGYKGDNSVYEWVARNLTASGYVVLLPDFVNNTSPWAETENGYISGLYCDSYGGNASFPEQYSGSNEDWPDVWPWVHELIDAGKYLVNATNSDYSYYNGNITVHLGDLIDTDRLAVMGHSTGGSMALVAAMVYKWFKLAIAYAPYDDTVGEIYWPPYPSDYLVYQYATPILIMVGTNDVVTPKTTNSEQIYSHSNSPKLLVEIEHGNHMYFVDSEDILDPDFVPLEVLPITPTSLGLAHQQDIAMNITTKFLNHYFDPLSSSSPYAVPDDLDSDGIDDINKSFIQGGIIKTVNEQLESDLSLTIYANIVPYGIGWGNSTVSARFFDRLSNELDISPVTMDYQFGSVINFYAGRFTCRITQKPHSVEIDVKSTTGERFKSEKRVIIAG